MHAGMPVLTSPCWMHVFFAVQACKEASQDLAVLPVLTGPDKVQLTADTHRLHM